MSTNTYLGCSGAALTKLQVALIVCPAFILSGYNQANVGGLLTLSDWVKTFPEIDTVNTSGAEKSRNSTIQGVVVATLIIGATISTLSCSYTGNKFGRKNVLFAGAVCTLIGDILEASAFKLAHFIVGRFIVGLGVGQLMSIVPVWLSETSTSKNRGRHVVLIGVFTCLGYLLQSWINLGFFELKNGPVTWRPPLAIGTVFSLILISTVYLFPESPRWLAMEGRFAEASVVISALRGLPEDSIEVQSELAGIKLSLEESGEAMKLSDMFKMGQDKLLYRFSLCMLLQFFQQWSGTNLVSVYMPIIFQQNLGLSAELSRVLSGSALTWKFLASFISFFAIDRFGRRIAFIVSGGGMASCMLALAVATSFPSSNYSAQVAAGFFLFLFNTFVPIGFLGANFLYCTEVAPLRLRVAMSSISTANHWIWNFLIAMITPLAVNTIGYRFYIIFAVMGALVPISVYFLFPETMGRNLEEIDTLFRESPSVWATVRFAKLRPIAMPQEFSKTADGENATHVEKADV